MNQRKRMRQRVVAGLNNPFVMLPATRRPELLHWLDCWMREEQKVTDRLDP